MAKIVYGIHSMWDSFDGENWNSCDVLDRAFTKKEDAIKFMNDPNLAEHLRINPNTVEDLVMGTYDDGDPFAVIKFKVPEESKSSFDECTVYIQELDLFE